MDKPIIFSGPMVRAILEGRKSQTRRVLRPQPELQSNGLYHVSGGGGGVVNVAEEGVSAHAIDYQRFCVGDRLWVREAFGNAALPGYSPTWLYRADPETPLPPAFRWRPSIYMPRAASRLTLTVTDVRVQRLQEISEADAGAEGCNPSRWQFETPRDHFRTLWNSLNAQRGFGWDTNPWVVAISFSAERRNIDAEAA